MLIDYQDSRPIYEQIVENYKRLILKGALEPAEQMPSVRQLATMLSTNPNTVQRAYMELERQGYLYSVKGKGSFVRREEGQRERIREEIQDRIREELGRARELRIDTEALLAELAEEERDARQKGGKG